MYCFQNVTHLHTCLLNTIYISLNAMCQTLIRWDWLQVKINNVKIKLIFVLFLFCSSLSQVWRPRVPLTRPRREDVPQNCKTKKFPYTEELNCLKWTYIVKFKLVKGIFNDYNNIFLWYESEDINKKSLFSKFQLIPILRFQVMHDYVYFTAPIDYCVE